MNLGEEEMFQIDENVSLQYLRRMERVCQRLARSCNHVIFLRRCYSQGVVPKGLRLKFPIISRKAECIKSEAEKALVKERLNFWKRKRSVLYRSLDEMKEFLFGNMSLELANMNWMKLMEIKETEYEKCKMRQRRKFGEICKVSTSGANDRRSSFEDCVVNLSTSVLSEAEVQLLSKGLKYVPTPSEVPVVDIVTSVEEVVPSLSNDQAYELRHEIRRVLKNTSRPTSNLTVRNREAIRSLKGKADEIVVLQADKGNKVAVMDRRDYKNKLVAAISGKQFVKLAKDPTDSEQRKLVKLLTEIERKSELSRTERLRLTEKAPQCPIVYGLPKLHKEGVPLRIIFSFVGSPTYKVSKELARILSSLHGHTPSNVMDTKHMIDILKEVTMEEDEVLVSYDVVNLFGTVPAEEAARMAIKRIEEDSTLTEKTSMSPLSLRKLMEFCVRSTHFKCDGDVYRTSTCPIGSPLSPALASIFMEEFENRVLYESSIGIRMWRRYVDDTLAIVRKGTEVDVLNRLNKGHASIVFTCEIEESGRIPFLDIEVKREGRHIRTTVYRKQTATDRYLDFESAHCKQVKWGVLSCLRRRAERVCTQENDLRTEKNRLCTTFVKNGYPERQVRRRLYGVGRHREGTVDERPILRIPYIPGLHEKIEAVGRRLDIRVRCTRGRSLGDIVSRAKLDKIDELDRGGVIYKQECADCEKVYIGQTGRRAKERKKEHEVDVRDIRMRSAISEHCHTMNHRPNFQSFQVIDVERNWRRRLIKEGIHIMNNNTFNRDTGYAVDQHWRSILQ